MLQEVHFHNQHDVIILEFRHQMVISPKYLSYDETEEAGLAS